MYTDRRARAERQDTILHVDICKGRQTGRHRYQVSLCIRRTRSLFVQEQIDPRSKARVHNNLPLVSRSGHANREFCSFPKWDYACCSAPAFFWIAIGPRAIRGHCFGNVTSGRACACEWSRNRKPGRTWHTTRRRRERGRCILGHLHANLALAMLDS
jgi:hypothetical protein